MTDDRILTREQYAVERIPQLERELVAMRCRWSEDSRARRAALPFLLAGSFTAGAIVASLGAFLVVALG